MYGRRSQNTAYENIYWGGVGRPPAKIIFVGGAHMALTTNIAGGRLMCAACEDAFSQAPLCGSPSKILVYTLLLSRSVHFIRGFSLREEAKYRREILNSKFSSDFFYSG